MVCEVTKQANLVVNTQKDSDIAMNQGSMVA